MTREKGVNRYVLAGIGAVVALLAFVASGAAALWLIDRNREWASRTVEVLELDKERRALQEDVKKVKFLKAKIAKLRSELGEGGK